jgi:hypothetical protein
MDRLMRFMVLPVVSIATVMQKSFPRITRERRMTKKRYTLQAKLGKFGHVPEQEQGSGDIITFNLEVTEAEYRNIYRSLESGGWKIIHAWSTEETHFGALSGDWKPL